MLLILLSVLGISCGQVLLKLAAGKLSRLPAGANLLLEFAGNGYLVAGVFVLGCATLLWTWILRVVPLNQAYPFMALCFVIVPAICWFLLGETLSLRQLLGSALIVAGVVVVAL